MDILMELFNLQDEKYREFNGRLVPDCELIGVRIPHLRALAKRIAREDPKAASDFIEKLPHRYLEENHLHGFLLEGEKDFNLILEKTEIFLPYIDNWQTCDSFLPPPFVKGKMPMAETIEKWLFSQEEYTSRYAMRLMLARKDYNKNNIVNVIKAGESSAYYTYMGAAWYLSMAAKANGQQLIESFNQVEVSSRLRDATVRKIKESRQFTAEEKENFANKL